MNSRFASLLAALVVVSTVLGGVGFVADTTAAADDDVTVCNSEENMLGWLSGFFRGYGGGNAYTQQDGLTHANPNPCYMDGNTIDGDTKTEAARRLASLALEDKAYTMQYFDQWDNYAQRLQNPAIGDGRTAFIDAVMNGSEEIAAVTEAHTAAHERVAKQQLHLWRQYLSQTNALAGLIYQAQDAGVADNIRIGYINDSGTYKTGFKVARVTDPDFAANKSTATTVVTTSGEQIVVPTLYKYENTSGIGEGDLKTVNPLTQDVLVQVKDPESGGWEDIINTVEFTYSKGTTVADPADTRTIDLSNASKATFDVTISEAYRTQSGEPAQQTVFSVGNTEFKVDADSGGQPYWLIIKDGTVVKDGTASSTTSWTVHADGTVSVDGATYDLGTALDSITLTLDGSKASVSNLALWDSKTLASYTNQFRQRHNELESVDNAVIDVLGDSDSGLLSQLYEKLQSGNVSAQDYHTTGWYIQNAMETSDRGDQSWRAMMLSSMGYSLSDVDKTVTVDVLAGSTVDGQQINSTNTYSGWIATDSNPPNGTWQTNTTYSVGDGADLTKPVHIIYTEESGEWVNGTFETTVVSRTAVVSSGDITIQSITENGTEVGEADQHANDPNESNLTAVLEQVKQNQEMYKKLVEMMDEDNDGDSSDATGGGGDGPDFDPSSWFDWVPTPGDVVPDLPYGLIGIGIAGFGLVLLVGPMLGPLLIALWSRF